MSEFDTFQVVLNIYFVAVDYVLLFQVMFYERDKLNSTLRIVLLFTLLALWSFPLAPSGEKYSPWHKERAHVAPTHWYNEQQLKSLLGQLMGWLASLFYIVARFPQILANLRRDKSLESPSLQLFVASIVANACYVLFMVLGPPDPSLLAWIVSSVLTIILDVLIILQFLFAPHGATDATSIVSSSSLLPITLPSLSSLRPLRSSLADTSTTTSNNAETTSDNIEQSHDASLANVFAATDMVVESPRATHYKDASQQYHASHDSILTSVVISRDHDPSQQQRGRSPGTLRMPIWR